MPVPSTCPFCNALIPATAAVVAGRVLCPRCGEAVGTAETAHGPTTPRAPATTTATPDRRSVRRTVVTAVVLVLIALGLWGVSANWDRFRSPFGSPTPPAKPVVVKPAEMPGLGYLPESTEAVLAVQVPFLLQRLGPEAGDDPVQALVSLGLPEQLAELIDEATAVGLKNVDHLVMGIGFDSHTLPPQVTIVVHAARPFDLDGLARQEKARPLKREGRTLYAGRAGPLPEIYWWKAADRVLVATILMKDMDVVPEQPHAGIDHLRPAVTRQVTEAIAEDACAWFVASSDKWDQYLRPYTISGPFSFIPTPLRGRSDLLKPAERLRTVTLSVPNDADRKIEVGIGLKSAELGASLRSTLTERFAKEPVAVSGEEEWTRVQLPNDPTRIGSLVRRLTPERK